MQIKPILTYKKLRQRLFAVWLKAFPVTSITAAFPLLRYGTQFYVDITEVTLDPAVQLIQLTQLPSQNLTLALNLLSEPQQALAANPSLNIIYLEQRLRNIEQFVRLRVAAKTPNQATLSFGVTAFVNLATDALVDQIISVSTTGLASFDEGTLPTAASPATFVFSRAPSTASSASLAIDFQLSGTATYLTDYTIPTSVYCNPTTISNRWRVLFAPNQLTVSIQFFPVVDAVIEADETVIVTLVPAPQLIINTIAAAATWTILDDDALYLAINGGTFVRDSNFNLIEITQP